MPSDTPTFGCGTPLPGFGPNSFPSFGFGDTVDSGGGQEPPPPPEPVEPSPPVGPPPGVPGEGTPGTPGTPGTGPLPLPPTPPAIPGAPGTGGTFGCRCRVTGPPIIYSFPATVPTPGTFYRYTFKQSCKSVNLNDTNTSLSAISTYINGVLNPRYNPGARITSTAGLTNIDANCRGPKGSCNGPCGDVVITVFVPRNPVGTPNNPIGSTPPIVVDGGGPGGGGGGGGGGGVTITPVTTVGVFNPPIPVDTTPPPTTPTEPTETELTGFINNEDTINLNNPAIEDAILVNNSNGVQDPAIQINLNPKSGILVDNDVSTELFNDKINSNLHYVLANKNIRDTWDTDKVSAITPQLIYDNLNKKTKDLLSKIKNYNGSKISINQIYSMIGSRVLDGTFEEVNIPLLESLARGSEFRTTKNITRSTNQSVNEYVALTLVEGSMVRIDPNKYSDKMAKILPNWKTLSSDIDRYIPICTDEGEQRYYVKDDSTFVCNEPLGLEDGDYVCVKTGNEEQKLFTKSEVDHSFTIPEITRQQVVSLLGEDSYRKLEVSALESSNIEYNHSLSSPRQNFYMLSCVLSSIETTPSDKSLLLKKTRARFDLVPTSTDADLSAANEFIKYKINHRVFLIDDEDLLLDYIEETSSVHLSQFDVAPDSPKENKNIPLIARQYPWYILICPTNRPDYNPFSTKSKLLDLPTSGVIRRELKCITSIAPNLNKEQSNNFVRMETVGIDALNVIGETDPQTRIMKLNPNDTLFQQTYVSGNQYMPAQSYSPTRSKTGLRLVKEIINEIDSNYYLNLNGVGKTLTEFDVFSRLTLKQFNNLVRTDNFSVIRDAMRRGHFNNVKVINPIKNSSEGLSFGKSLLYRRKDGAAQDTYTAIKRTSDLQKIVPPTTDSLPKLL